jgi:serine/threonine protein kinase
MARHQAGQRISEWTLREPIKIGRNAEVWQAECAGQLGALKELNRLRGDNEPSQRFEREARWQRQLTDERFAGVLPVLDAYDPDDESVRRPWIVTPVAETMPDVVPSLPVSERVAAIQSIADTLARLHARGVTHRDIKPDNLFRYQQHWVLGDFGLVHVDEDVEQITDAAAVLGPRFFMADEMIRSAATADGAPADVYSLAKVLWVVLTGQNYPYPGTYQPHERLMQLSTFVEHPRLGVLDQLIARATSLRPDQRPSAGDFARELDMWRTELASLIPTPRGGLEAIRERPTRAMRPADQLGAGRVELAQQVQATFGTMSAALLPIQQAYTLPGRQPPAIEDTPLVVVVDRGRPVLMTPGPLGRGLGPRRGSLRVSRARGHPSQCSAASTPKCGHTPVRGHN